MSLDYIRKYYSVPARRGGRVAYTGERTICGARGSHLSIRLDGCKHTMPFHPTWELRYLDKDESAAPPAAVIGDQGETK
jgi:hypothetical protein